MTSSNNLSDLQTQLQTTTNDKGVSPEFTVQDLQQEAAGVLPSRQIHVYSTQLFMDG